MNREESNKTARRIDIHHLKGLNRLMERPCRSQYRKYLDVYREHLKASREKAGAVSIENVEAHYMDFEWEWCADHFLTARLLLEFRYRNNEHHKEYLEKIKFLELLPEDEKKDRQKEPYMREYKRKQALLFCELYNNDENTEAKVDFYKPVSEKEIETLKIEVDSKDDTLWFNENFMKKDKQDAKCK